MGTSQLVRRARRARSEAVFAVVLLSFAAAVGVSGTAGAASTPKPTGIVAAASTDNTGLDGAVPAVLVAQDDSFTLTVTLTPAGAQFNTATKLDLTVDGGTGSLSPTSAVMPANTNSASFALSYDAVANGISLTVSVARTTGRTSGVTPGTTARFDVLKTVTKFPSGDARLATGLGVGDAGCTDTTSEPECGTLVLSHGLASSLGALTLGACTPTVGVIDCTRGSQVVQFVAGISYSPADPAVLVVRCSKQLCPGRGVNSYSVKISFDPTGPLSLTAAPCVSKGVALDAAGNDFCTDYVQSHRDTAGDVLLHLLFTHDMRAST